MADPRPPTVLIADDAPEVCAAAARLFRRRGFETVTAADGGEAIELLQKQKIDAAILDLQMPGTDGFAVLDYVAEHRRALPVMLLSGLPADQIQDRMENLKQDQALPPLFLKPVDYDQLGEVLELLLSGDLPAVPSQPADHD